jgi:hypothetical protein
LQTRIGVFETDFQVVAQVRATAGATATTAAALLPAHEIAEEILEHVGEGGGEIALTLRAAEATGARAAGHAAIEGRMAEPVIRRFLVAILQDVVGLVHFLELGLGVGVVGVAIGVQFLRLLAEGFLDLVAGRASFDPQNLVVVAFGHVRASAFWKCAGRPRMSRPARQWCHR